MRPAARLSECNLPGGRGAVHSRHRTPIWSPGASWRHHRAAATGSEHLSLGADGIDTAKGSGSITLDIELQTIRMMIT